MELIKFFDSELEAAIAFARVAGEGGGMSPIIFCGLLMTTKIDPDFLREGIKGLAEDANTRSFAFSTASNGGAHPNQIKIREDDEDGLLIDWTTARSTRISLDFTHGYIILSIKGDDVSVLRRAEILGRDVQFRKDGTENVLIGDLVDGFADQNEGVHPAAFK